MHNQASELDSRLGQFLSLATTIAKSGQTNLSTNTKETQKQPELKKKSKSDSESTDSDEGANTNDRTELIGLGQLNSVTEVNDQEDCNSANLSHTSEAEPKEIDEDQDSNEDKTEQVEVEEVEEGEEIELSGMDFDLQRDLLFQDALIKKEYQNKPQITSLQLNTIQKHDSLASARLTRVSVPIITTEPPISWKELWIPVQVSGIHEEVATLWKMFRDLMIAIQKVSDPLISDELATSRRNSNMKRGSRIVTREQIHRPLFPGFLLVR